MGRTTDALDERAEPGDDPSLQVEQNQYLRTNRELWDNWAELHYASAGSNYDVAGFKAGHSTLYSVDRDELGDVAGKTLLHLQCHFGADTLSLARLGAQVTGVDFSESAIAIARGLSAELGIPARFICSNLYDLPEHLEGTFDIVYTSHGVLGWLPDLRRWAEIIARFLAPGGEFVVVEGHPFAHVFGESGERLEVRYPYFEAAEPLRFETRGSYGNPTADYESVEYFWSHSLSEIVASLLAAGLRIERLREYPFISWPMVPNMWQDADGWWHQADGSPSLPLMFSLTARKPA